MTQTPRRTIESPLDRVARLDSRTYGKGPAIGIDLGGTNCRVAVMQNGAPVCIGPPPAQAIPVYVALGPGNKIVSGQAAQRLLASAPQTVVWGIKRLLGTSIHTPAAQALCAEVNCKIEEGLDGEVYAWFGDRCFSAVELAAFVLFEARELAQNHLREPVYRAVIATPPTKNEALVQAFTAAANLAGLHVDRTISEPTAAVLAAQRKKRSRGERTIAIYDWGGGKFQISLVKVSENQSQVLATESDHSLGGAVLDRSLLDQVLRAVSPDESRAPDRASMLRVADAVERSKIALSQTQESRIRLPFVTWTDGSTGDFDAMLNRQALEAILSPWLEKSIAICERVLDRKSMFPGDVSEVLLVGEQTRMPLIRERVAKCFYQVPINGDESGQLVAIGTALAGNRAAAAAK